MPPAKVDLKAQAKELAEDLEIPRVTLVSRSAVAAKPEQEPEISVEQEPVIVPKQPEPPVKRAAHPVAPIPVVEENEEFNPLESLARSKQPELKKLNARVEPWVDDALEQALLDMGKRRLKVTKEKVVQEAIIQYLRLKRPTQ